MLHFMRYKGYYIVLRNVMLPYMLKKLFHTFQTLVLQLFISPTVETIIYNRMIVDEF